MNKKIMNNFFYNLLYQLVIALVPLITLPYKTRVLSPDTIGVYSYVFSVLSYVLMLGSIGMGLYGQRSIAYVKDNRFERSRILYELILLKAMSLFIVAVIFYLFFGLSSIYRVYYLIFGVEIFISMFDVTWFFQGIEDFKRISLINIVTRVLNVIFIFLFVKSDSDLLVYVVLTVVFDVLPIILLLFSLLKYVQLVNFKDIRVFSHLKLCLLLFIPQICIQIYTECDKIMLGSLQGDISEVGYYDYSNKIIQIVLKIIISLTTIMLPVIAYQFSVNNHDKIKRYVDELVNFVVFFGLPITFGLISVCDNLVLVIFGSNYFRVSILLKILAFSILPISLTDVVERYLISTKNEVRFTVYIVIGMFVNLVLNLVLIRYFSSVGVALATIVTEFVVLFIEFPIIKKLVNVGVVIGNFFRYGFFSVLMMVLVYMVGQFGCSVWVLLVQVLVGLLFYLFLLILTRDSIFSSLIDKFRR